MRTTVTALVVGLVSAGALASQHIAPSGAQPPMPEGTTTTATAPMPAGTVARAQFTSAIQDREPVDNLTSLSNDKTQVYFYTELKNLAGSKVTHRWEYKGQVMAEQPFDVGAERWRVWSSKTFDPLWTGEWKVSVVDGSGATLAVQTFDYSPKAETPAAAPAATPAPATPKSN